MTWLFIQLKHIFIQIRMYSFNFDLYTKRIAPLGKKKYINITQIFVFATE